MNRRRRWSNSLLMIVVAVMASACSSNIELIPAPTQEEVDQGKILDLDYFYTYGELMFKNDEPREVYLTKHRSFYADKMINADLYANTVAFIDTISDVSFDEISLDERTRLLGQVRVFNGVAVDIKDIELYCEINGFDGKILVASLPVLPAHYTLTFPFNLAHGERTFTTVEGNEIAIENLEEYLPSDFVFSMESNDEVFQKLNSIKVKTLCSFKDYDWPIGDEKPVDNWETNSWGRTYAVHARRYTSSIAGINYHLSQPYFLEELVDYAAEQDVILHDAGYDVDEEGNRLYSPNMNIVDVVDFHERFLEKATIFYGVCQGPSGLGGGNVLGVSSNLVINETGAHIDPGTIWAHEMGHVLGYGHDSNMTYSDSFGGWTVIWRAIFGRHEADRPLIGGEIMYPQEYEVPVEQTVSMFGIQMNESHDHHDCATCCKK